MIIEHTSIKFTKGVDIELTRRERKEIGAFEGRRIINHLAFSSAGSKQPKSKIQTPANRGQIQNQTFRELLSKRDRYKQSSSKMESKHTKRHVEDNRSEKNCHPTVNKSYSKEKSKSKSKGLSKSKSLKHLGKKSKSMIRLQAKQKKENHQQKYQRQQRKSQSPQKHIKSTISLADKKNHKSNYNSKTTRQLVSQLTTDRDKSKGKIKKDRVSKPFKKIKKTNDEGKKKTSSKIVSEKKKNVEKQKQNGKVEKKLKPKNKQTREKKVIISQQTSKVKRNEQYEEENSQNQDEFLDSKQKKNQYSQKNNKQSNIVQIPKRKERLSLNSNNKRYFQNKAIKTEIQIQQQLSKIKDRQNYAAIMIQKVYRGHLTRKYIRQCLQHNAAINIQRVWKGYITRKRLYQFLEKRSQIQQLENLKSQKDHSKRQRGGKIFQQEEYLLQRSSSKQDQIKSIYRNQNWASILQQIMSQESVNNNLKKKIETFLQHQRKQMNEFDFRSNNSARSNISNQIVTNQYNSQKHFMQSFIQQEKRKKQFPNMNVFISPKSYKSPKRGGYNSPQTYNIGSPTYLFPQRLDQSRELTSSEMLLSYLRNIQNFHKQRLQIQAKSDQYQLNKLLLKNQLSPRTHQKRYKEVQEGLDNELTKFNESINEIVKNYKLYRQSPDVSRQYEKGKPYQGAILDDQMITPKKELVQLEVPFDMPEECINSQKLQEYEGEQYKKVEQASQQFCQYYKFQKQELRKDEQHSKFDTSYQFVEQYLINLCDFVIHFEDKSQISRIVTQLKKSRSHSAQTILGNMKIVTETSEQQEQQQLENSFKLPMYKYIDLDETILDSNIIQEFNSIFHRFNLNEVEKKNQLQSVFVKMIIQCMNQALNSMRPTSSLFTETRIKTLYEQRNCEIVPNLENYQISQEQYLLQIMFAQAMRKIFYWNKPEMGKQASLKQEEQGENFQTLFDSLDNKDQTQIRLQVAKQDWIFYEQMIEVVGAITQQLFEIIIFEEIAQMWQTLMRASNQARGKDIQPISTSSNPYSY